jgi:hypothetical protein
VNRTTDRAGDVSAARSVRLIRAQAPHSREVPDHDGEGLGGPRLVVAQFADRRRSRCVADQLVTAKPLNRDDPYPADRGNLLPQGLFIDVTGVAGRAVLPGQPGAQAGQASGSVWERRSLGSFSAAHRRHRANARMTVRSEL